MPMTDYRRASIAGGTYFFTQVTHQRQPWLCTDVARPLLRAAFLKVQQKYPFCIDAIVLLPDHIHYNPVRHGLCGRAVDWPYSSFQRYVAKGVYPIDWGLQEMMISPVDVGDGCC